MDMLFPHRNDSLTFCQNQIAMGRDFMPDEKNNAYEQYAYCNFQINHQKHGDANLQPHQAMLNRLFDTTILLDSGPAMTQVINSTADQP
jgi:hypothetical protein